MKGTVKWYNARKGYGFITPEDKGDDVFVHAIELKSCGINKLFTGSEVTFDVDQDEKGKRARNLKITKEVKPETKEGKQEKKPEVKEEKNSQKEGKPEKKPEVKKEKKTVPAKKTQKSKPKKKEKTTGKKTNKK